MSDEDGNKVPMAECGSCRTIIPLDSESCPECNTQFSGVSEDALGECGACNKLVPLESTRCPECGVVFVADDVIDILRNWVNETGINIRKLFDKFDENSDGTIDSGELKRGLLGLNLADLPPSQVERLVTEIDRDDNGVIDLDEFENILNGDEDSETENPEEATSQVEGEDLAEEKLDDDDSDVGGQDSDDADVEFSADEAFMKLGMAISEQGLTIREVFETMDTDSSGLIMGPELQKGIEEILGENMDSSTIYSILKILDQDDDGNVDPMELIKGLEALDLGIDSDDTEMEGEDLDEEMDDVEYDLEDETKPSALNSLAKLLDENGVSAQRFFNDLDKDGNGLVSIEELRENFNKQFDEEFDLDEIEILMDELDIDGDGMVDIMEFIERMEELDDHYTTLEEGVLKEFPSPMQKKMMSKSWNDAVWPLIHTAFGILIVILLVNALIGPVDGSGGMVEYASKTTGNPPLNDIGAPLQDGDIYVCDESFQDGGCPNSLTPLAGENGASSMPKGFYWDGMLGLAIGFGGIAWSLITHLAIVPGWRARARAMKEVEADMEDAVSDSEDEEEEPADDEEQENDASEGDESGEGETEEDGDDEDDVQDGDDEIDIGSYVGIVLEDEEIFGTILEFDDDEGTVTVEEDGTGDLVTGYQDEMFLPE